MFMLGSLPILREHIPDQGNEKKKEKEKKNTMGNIWASLHSPTPASSNSIKSQVFPRRGITGHGELGSETRGGTDIFHLTEEPG
jgi:hypothetical protein